MSETIEIRPALLESPKVREMAQAIRDSPEFRARRGADLAGTAGHLMRRAVVGTLVGVWSACRALAPDGVFHAATTGTIDEIAGIPGFARAMVRVGWLEEGPDGVRLPNFGEHNPRPRKPKARARNPPAPPADEGFDAFWAAYPRKVGKGAARASWARIRPPAELAAAILAAVKRQRGCEQWLRENGRFVPLPATWLNQRRWEDEGPEPEAALAPPSREDAIRRQHELVRELAEQKRKARGLADDAQRVRFPPAAAAP